VAPARCDRIIGVVTGSIQEAPEETDWRSLALLYTGNVLFAAGLFAHAFLFNFYIRELQLPATVMGHQVAAMTLGGLCALLPAGVVIDRVGLRPALLAGVAMTTLGLVLTAIFRSPAGIYVAAFGIGLGGATCRVSWGPAIMRLTAPASRSRAFAWNAAILIATGSGWTWLAGDMAGWASFGGLGGLSGTQVVLVAGAAVTLTATLCYAVLRFPAVPPQGARFTISGLGLPTEARVLVPLIAFWMLAAALVLPFFNVFFVDRFAMPVARVGAMFGIAHVVAAGVLVGAAELARRWGARQMLVAWMAISAPLLLWLSQTEVLSVAITLYFLQGLIGPATNPLIDQLLLERAPRERHGIVAGWRNAAAEGAGALGASGGGKLLDAGSFPLLFLAAGGVAAAAAWLLGRSLVRVSNAEHAGSNSAKENA
jgi:MFS family permease